MAVIRVRNVRTGVVSTMTREQWEKVRDSKQWLGVFKPVSEPEPAEVRQIRERKKSSSKSKSARNNDTEQAIGQEPEAEKEQKED